MSTEIESAKSAELRAASGPTEPASRPPVRPANAASLTKSATPVRLQLSHSKLNIPSSSSHLLSTSIIEAEGRGDPGVQLSQLPLSALQSSLSKSSITASHAIINAAVPDSARSDTQTVDLANNVPSRSVADNRQQWRQGPSESPRSLRKAVSLGSNTLRTIAHNNTQTLSIANRNIDSIPELSATDIASSDRDIEVVLRSSLRSWHQKKGVLPRKINTETMTEMEKTWAEGQDDDIRSYGYEAGLFADEGEAGGFRMARAVVSSTGRKLRFDKTAYAHASLAFADNNLPSYAQRSLTFGDSYGGHMGKTQLGSSSLAASISTPNSTPHTSSTHSTTHATTSPGNMLSPSSGSRIDETEDPRQSLILDSSEALLQGDLTLPPLEQPRIFDPANATNNNTAHKPMGPPRHLLTKRYQAPPPTRSSWSTAPDRDHDKRGLAPAELASKAYNHLGPAYYTINETVTRPRTTGFVQFIHSNRFDEGGGDARVEQLVSEEMRRIREERKAGIFIDNPYLVESAPPKNSPSKPAVGSPLKAGPASSASSHEGVGDGDDEEFLTSTKAYVRALKKAGFVPPVPKERVPNLMARRVENVLQQVRTWNMQHALKVKEFQQKRELTEATQHQIWTQQWQTYDDSLRRKQIKMWLSAIFVAGAFQHLQITLKRHRAEVYGATVLQSLAPLKKMVFDAWKEFRRQQRLIWAASIFRLHLRPLLHSYLLRRRKVKVTTIAVFLQATSQLLDFSKHVRSFINRLTKLQRWCRHICFSIVAQRTLLLLQWDIVEVQIRVNALKQRLLRNHRRSSVAEAIDKLGKKLERRIDRINTAMSAIEPWSGDGEEGGARPNSMLANIGLALLSWPRIRPTAEREHLHAEFSVGLGVHHDNDKDLSVGHTDTHRADGGGATQRGGLMRAMDDEASAHKREEAKWNMILSEALRAAAAARTSEPPKSAPSDVDPLLSPPRTESTRRRSSISQQAVHAGAGKPSTTARPSQIIAAPHRRTSISMKLPIGSEAAVDVSFLVKPTLDSTKVAEEKAHELNAPRARRQSIGFLSEDDPELQLHMGPKVHMTAEPAKPRRAEQELLDLQQQVLEDYPPFDLSVKRQKVNELLRAARKVHMQAVRTYRRRLQMWNGGIDQEIAHAQDRVEKMQGFLTAEDEVTIRKAIEKRKPAPPIFLPLQPYEQLEDLIRGMYVSMNAGKSGAVPDILPDVSVEPRRPAVPELALKPMAPPAVDKSSRGQSMRSSVRTMTTAKSSARSAASEAAKSSARGKDTDRSGAPPVASSKPKATAPGPGQSARGIPKPTARSVAPPTERPTAASQETSEPKRAARLSVVNLSGPFGPE